MLFNYHYVQHPIEAFQAWLDHLVKQVWCRASGAYSLNLLHPELRQVVEDIHRDRRIQKDHLAGPIKKIDGLFRELTPAQRQQVAAWYDNNNDIEALCNNDPTKPPATYRTIGAINTKLANKLKAFCNNLFEEVIHLRAVTSRIGSIDEHYDIFVTVNKENKCPFCGYGDIKSSNRRIRDAYDHYLPKADYPFNSVNFHNLAPICYECNSGYKLGKDPTWNIDPINRKRSGSRRKAFYSYAALHSGITISITFKTRDIANLKPDDIQLSITAPGRDEEVEAWRDVFGIDERYKDKCCLKNDGRVWLRRILEDYQHYGLTREAMLKAEIRAAESNPWSDMNFLKRPFLIALQEANVIRN